jgi:hypothetical protein
MRRALVLTAYNRPEYLRKVLQSWLKVRGLHEWHIVARIEPGELEGEVYDLLWRFYEESQHPTMEIIVNPQPYGVLHHPWVAFEELFAAGYDFVVRAEDDLVVSDDILEYFTWASEYFASADSVATVHAFAGGHGDASAVVVHPSFNPWIWGTWRGVWDGLIGPTWDHDYSTFNDFPGNQSGWDWNLNTRVFPAEGMSGAYPLSSRVNNIGVHGVHGTPENHATSPSFHDSYGPQPYEVRVDIT